MRHILYVIILLFCPATLYGDILDIYTNSCMVHNASGFFFDEDKDNYFVMTAGHVIENLPKNNIQLTLYYSGFLSHPIFARKLFEINQIDTVNDLAVVYFDKKQLKAYPKPTVLSLAAKNYVIKPRSVIYSAGHPNSNWTSLWRGNISQVFNHKFMFFPTAIGGRSGSGIFNENNEAIGVIIWKNGTAVSVQTIYVLLERFNYVLQTEKNNG